MNQVLPFSFLCTPIQKLPSPELVQVSGKIFRKKKDGRMFPVLSHRQVPSGLAPVRRAEEKVGIFSLFLPSQSLVF